MAFLPPSWDLALYGGIAARELSRRRRPAQASPAWRVGRCSHSDSGTFSVASHRTP